MTSFCGFLCLSTFFNNFQRRSVSLRQLSFSLKHADSGAVDVQVSLSIVGWRSLFNERTRWRRVLTIQLILLLLMPPLLMTVGVVSFLQKSKVKSVGRKCTVVLVDGSVCTAVCNVHCATFCITYNHRQLYRETKSSNTLHCVPHLHFKTQAVQY